MCGQVGPAGAAVQAKISALQTRLSSLPAAALPTSEEGAAIRDVLREGAASAPAVVAACELVAALCNCGSETVDVAVRGVLGSSGCLAGVQAAVTQWRAQPAVLVVCLTALSELCGGKTFGSRCEANIALVMADGGMPLVRSLLAVEGMEHVAVADAALTLCLRLSRPDEAVVPLMSLVDVATALLEKHASVPSTVGLFFGFLRNLGFADANKVQLMTLVDTAIAALRRHSDAPPVVGQVLWFLRNLCAAKENRASLMGHTDVLVSAMSRLSDDPAVVEGGLRFLWFLSEVEAHRAQLVTSVGSAMSAMNGHLDVADIVEAGLGFFDSLSSDESSSGELMAQVDDVVAAMACHVNDADVVERGVHFLFCQSSVEENCIALAVHAAAVVSAIGLHAENEYISMHGIYFLYNLSTTEDNLPVLQAVPGVAAAVRAGVDRHGTADDGELKEFGDTLLAKLAE